MYSIFGASQVALVVKNPPANAGDVRDSGQSLGWEDPLEEGMATHSSTLAWRIPMDRGAWQATVHGVSKSWTRLKQVSTHAHNIFGKCFLCICKECVFQISSVLSETASQIEWLINRRNLFLIV